MINHKDYTYEEFMRIGAYQCAFRQLACEAVPYRNINLLMSAFNDPVSSRLSLVAWYDYLPEIEKMHKESKKNKRLRNRRGVYFYNMRPLYLWREQMRVHSRLRALRKKYALDKSSKG